MPFLSQVFMPLVMTIYQVLNVPADANDRVEAEEKKLLQRGYFLFLATIATNCLDVLKAQGILNYLLPLQSRVVSYILHLAFHTFYGFLFFN